MASQNNTKTGRKPRDQMIIDGDVDISAMREKDKRRNKRNGLRENEIGRDLRQKTDE